jgi:hypothetical protein
MVPQAIDMANQYILEYRLASNSVQIQEITYVRRHRREKVNPNAVDEDGPNSHVGNHPVLYRRGSEKLLEIYRTAQCLLNQNARQRISSDPQKILMKLEYSRDKANC